MYKFVDWIDINKINWNILSFNENAISILEKNLDKINWYNLSENINAISILEKNLDKVNWNVLSKNANAINILKDNLDKISWDNLSENENIFELDLKFLKNRMDIIREELMMKVYHPVRFERYMNMSYDIADDNYVFE